MSMSISSSYDWLLEQQESRALAARSKTTATDETQQAQQVSAEQEVQTQTAESAQIKPSGGSADTVQISAQGRAYQAALASQGAAQSAAQASDSSSATVEAMTAQAQAGVDPATMTQNAAAQAVVQEASVEAASVQAAAKQAPNAVPPVKDEQAEQAGVAPNANGVADSTKLAAQADEKMIASLSDMNEEEETATEVSSSSDSTVNLANLSEQEISDLVDEGTISQAEANTELAKREAMRRAAEDTQDVSEEAAKEPEKKIAQQNPAVQSYLQTKEQTDPAASDAQTGAALNAVA